MKKYIASVGISILLLLSFAGSAFAYNLETGEDVVLNQNLLDDTYVLSGNATIKADVFGDLYVVGGFVVVDGNVAEDLVVAGGRVIVTGNVGGDVRIIGGMVTIYGNVGDDLVVISGIVDVAKDSVISGDVLIAADRLFLEGTVGGNIKGVLSNLNLNGTVGKDVDVTIQDSVFISETGHIGGNLEYIAFVESEIADGLVDGVTQYNKYTRNFSELFEVFLSYTIKSYLGALLLLLILVLFAENALIKSSQIARENVSKAFGVGILFVILACISAFILASINIGIPIAIILLCLLVVAFFFSKIFVAMFFSTYMIKKNKKFTKKRLYGVLSLILLAYYILTMIPIIGWIINLTLFFLGVGIIVLLKIEHLKTLRLKKLL